VPEIVEHSVTGFVVNNLEEAIAATSEIERLDRRACRATFERRFTASRMASDYVRLYEQLISRADTDLVA
jgi:glycosyltransferase involved in cell wall biosynthesis